MALKLQASFRQAGAPVVSDPHQKEEREEDG